MKQKEEFRICSHNYNLSDHKAIQNHDIKMKGCDIYIYINIMTWNL